ncbi:bifunctional phosphoribosylaminoimidazolecarboxamide formyltransferase/IMP cyclohydrolase [Rickettsiales bacterium]|nr:bifunctional phosphoribosylaminoimidazolecarboxamide formyltransferase/IMP cyclohydrolase [Rickettsiales bacterium]
MTLTKPTNNIENFPMTNKIKRALISVSDKANLDKLAEILKEYKIEVLSTGGTAKALRQEGLEVIDVSEYTNFPEMMDGRVKTLHPKIHGGLLACLDNEGHVNSMKEHDIPSIDLVIVNLYPFEATVARGADFEETIENIDIGGPSMVRSAAKNYNFTTIITDAADYEVLEDELSENNGDTSLDFRKKMAAKAFARTASYDSAISSWFSKQVGQEMPDTLNISASLKQNLRYGENPHQKAAFYIYEGQKGIGSAKQLQGKELSYNNINDADAALQIVLEFQEPAAVIVKHANPCGVAQGSNIEEAYTKALASDPVSAFGGILAFNRPITTNLANEISKMFVEAIIAPSLEEEAKKIFAQKKNLRVLTIDDLEQTPKHLTTKAVIGGLLVQENDHQMVGKSDLNIVTKRKPTDAELESLLFSFKVCKHVKSNAIVLVKDNATIGIGAGQMSRVDSSRIAAMKAADCKENPDRAKGSVLASDAFFPFADGLIQAAEVGVTAVIQPGGSIRDEEVIKAADDNDIAMVFTSERHFRH